jgi:quinol monooxygenase YgiN
MLAMARRRTPSSEWARFVIRFQVLDADRFCAMAAEMAAVGREEPATLVYDWYFDDATQTATLYEAYGSPEALSAHGSGAVFTDIAPRYAGCMSVISVDVFGATQELERRDILGAPTTWWGAPIAAVTDAR